MPKSHRDSSDRVAATPIIANKSYTSKQVNNSSSSLESIELSDAVSASRKKTTPQQQAIHIRSKATFHPAVDRQPKSILFVHSIQKILTINFKIIAF
jgi:hypothetical protein